MTSVELHQKLGSMIDKARVEPVVVTKHDRDHVVIVSAERFAQMEEALRRARLTGSLTAKERKAAAEARVPSEAQQKHYLAALATAVDETEP
ncbi:MAG: type II toxin-antitoxin system prevent-host-death family antitoxin [Hyphomicrobiaceae bacterium]